MIVQVWQKINESRHSCHSWQQVEERIVSAMVILLLVLVLFLSAGVASLLGRTPDTRDHRVALWH